MDDTAANAGPPDGPRPGYNATAVGALGQVRLDWRHKAIPGPFQGLTASGFAAEGVRLSELQTPLLTLNRTAMTENLERMAQWSSAHGVLLAPHGKTTMAPQLWAEQLDRGAWGITLATPAQLRVAHGHGVARVQLANALTDPRAIAWVSSVTDEDFQVVSWVDSVQGVELIESTLSAVAARTGIRPAPLRVLAELGGPGGRSGARSIDTVLEIAGAVAASAHLELVGVGGYEGSLAHTADSEALDTVRGYLGRLLEAHRRVLATGYYAPDTDLMLSAGGSAFFDEVIDVLCPAIEPGSASAPRVDVVIRSGAYLVHDDGFYRRVSPFSRNGAKPLRSAMHGWARVLSQPEQGLALLDGGKRDFPYDEGLPEPQMIGPDLGSPMSELAGATISALNDQHAFLRFDPATTSVGIGDVVRLGLSHPCTAFDKWSLIPVIDDSPIDQRVTDLIHTFFQ